METRKKGGFPDASGNLRKELEQMEILDEEQGLAEKNMTFTNACGVFLTIVCC